MLSSFFLLLIFESILNINHTCEKHLWPPHHSNQTQRKQPRTRPRQAPRTICTLSHLLIEWFFVLNYVKQDWKYHLAAELPDASLLRIVVLCREINRRHPLRPWGVDLVDGGRLRPRGHLVVGLLRPCCTCSAGMGWLWIWVWPQVKAATFLGEGP